MAAKKSSGSRRSNQSASKSVASAMHREKQGTLRRGKQGHGGKVTDPKQAIAIGLSEAREKGARVPAKKSAAKRTPAKRTTAKRTTAKKSTAKRSTAKSR